MGYLGVLLITANIGSLSDTSGSIQQNWLQELYKTVQSHAPSFIALHLQEVGGKRYWENMSEAENFIGELTKSKELSSYDRSKAFIDQDFTQLGSFTALGSVYLIHNSLHDIHIYNFQDDQFDAVSGHTMCLGSLENCPNLYKEKFPQDFWTDFPWTRKGFMRTRWRIHSRIFDLVNLHLFHDASNLVSCSCSPSVYSGNRRRALQYILDRLNEKPEVPYFLFGDFNFRLDLKSLIQALGLTQRIRNETETETIVYEKDGELRLLLQCKRFEHENVNILQENSGQWLLRFDSEPIPFLNGLSEVQITFPPSYPYSESVDRPAEFMSTRCPAWCDRVFMSHPARMFLQKGNIGESCVVYDRIGSDVCMGDHKPVFLYFETEIENPVE
ncbi:inositol polyphosphate-5-phosphatase A [Bombina bombina]|uniref:inositol polyphosphate-5-phosphatase A n=1 Tax=Bombina bombina TaxID=8345 RepID=UPI00235B0440|nr:inositol polyphosphate-5-phosphatase A [Bombina bombina]